ncbi:MULTISPECIES: stage II sporulation protein M [Halorubrum]|uniref:Stage II sporulation protein M n=1 Tax=Halorubrum sodomense TaxID=35743 RepID=A0A1I6FV89_HALSD|nr:MULTISPECIES: stage II sporulation protein M [Halorubrum]TKX53468.1 stage II sporulation protein M [Halorubrum sp. SP3]TKX69573.1 stage II sporulation protein M [Halorubrum sp. SP9]SFR33850.1 Stage II sporulation protein M [Halorubrum sodomense]
MDLSAAVTAATATLRRRPADVLPFYLLGTAVPVIARLGTFAALAGIYLHLELTGRLAAARDALGGIEPPPETQDPAALRAWAEGLTPAFEPLLTPTVAVLFAAGVLVTVVLAVVAYTVISAGQLSAVAASLRDERGLVGGIAGARSRWLTFLGLYVAELLLWIGVIALGSLAVGAAFLANPFLGAAVAVAALLVGFVALALVRILFAFAPVAVVVDDAGVVGGVEGAGGFVRSNPVDAAAYLVVAIGALIAVASVASGVAFLGGGAVVALASAVVVAPALDLLKTALYGDYRGTVDPVSAPEAGVRAQLGGGLRRGWRELTGFVRSTPGHHALAIAVAVGFGAVGWTAAAPFAGAVPTSIEARLVGHVPPVAALTFFGNNWGVAIATAFSGVGLAVPALSSLAFNGLALGATAALEENLLALVAFVVPHGIFEIPAIVVSGALGIRLGAVSWRAFRGRASRERFADALATAFWVTVGIGIVLGVAAVIEGFVSPYYWRPFL